MKQYSEMLRPENVPQTEPLPGAENVKNAAGGYTFGADEWTRARRFLTLGTEGGTYYAAPRKITADNMENVRACIQADGPSFVLMVRGVSEMGLALKNDPAILALAAATVWGDGPTREAAFEAVHAVCRTGTHIFQFAEAREALMGGWGRGMRDAVGGWYLNQSVDDLVFQVLKYRQREGWSHRDLLRLAHPEPESEERALVFDAVCRPDGWEAVARFNELAELYLDLQSADTEARVVSLIRGRRGVPRELVPTRWLKDPGVWSALLDGMPLTAMIRNLGNMSKAGILGPFSEDSKHVINALTDSDRIQRARVHPFRILYALKTYSSGRGARGSGSWPVNEKIVDALDDAFHGSFRFVQPSGKCVVLALDVSASMGWSAAGGVMTCAEAAAAMAMATARVEREYAVVGFCDVVKDLGIGARDSLRDVVRKTSDMTFGATDASAAVRWAEAAAPGADALAFYTDNETWYGHEHTSVALGRLRRRSGKPVKAAAVAFTATRNSIVDERDPLCMNFVGMDASLPDALSVFMAE